LKFSRKLSVSPDCKVRRLTETLHLCLSHSASECEHGFIAGARCFCRHPDRGRFADIEVIADMTSGAESSDN
jgi:hypothetical protein